MEEEKFKHLIAQVGEHFKDYVLIVRCDKGMMFRSSDNNWSLGAISRLANEIQDKDKFELLKLMRGDE